jgi:hypothetical protein
VCSQKLCALHRRACALGERRGGRTISTTCRRHSAVRGLASSSPLQTSRAPPSTHSTDTRASMQMRGITLAAIAVAAMALVCFAALPTVDAGNSMYASALTMQVRRAVRTKKRTLECIAGSRAMLSALSLPYNAVALESPLRVRASMRSTAAEREKDSRVHCDTSDHIERRRGRSNSTQRHNARSHAYHRSVMHSASARVHSHPSRL